jgi:polyribonucleotide nucleotidyltransferase
LSTSNRINTKTFTFCNQEITLETGKIARQAMGSVLATMGNLQILATVVAEKEAKEKRDFFPLSVHYVEKSYATGRIPGGFNKREGKPSDQETLISRLIDRPLRPLFPKGFMNEVQVILTVISADKNTPPDVLAMIAASAALSISGIPFNGPIGAARVGLTEQQGYILNPTYEQLQESELDMVVAGSKSSVLMVESDAQELTEDEMLGAILFAHKEYSAAIDAINEFAAAVNTPLLTWEPPVTDLPTVEFVKEKYSKGIEEAYCIKSKVDRNQKLNILRKEASSISLPEDSELKTEEIPQIFSNLEKAIVRHSIISGNNRIDGRDTTTVRDISSESGLLKKTHGSALFTRGETQALVVTTLGNSRDRQTIDSIFGESKENFMLHYNFPPYSVGECGRFGGFPGRREVGHGTLAKRSLKAVMPSLEEFPYSIRVVSEITESNGSSSMASVCGATLALLDAGVPLSEPVAGIAMGLIKEDKNVKVLTDILGDEDHLGDMDFKVAGTKNGVTALQMDMKISEIDEQIMETALEQARRARLYILDKMKGSITNTTGELSANAPMTKSFTVSQDKIRDIIGKGGSNIRSICEQTGANIEISDDGVVKVFGATKAICEEACDTIYGYIEEVEIGKTYMGTVSKVADFGAFVRVLPGQDGLLHISQVADHRIDNVHDYLYEGQILEVIVASLDNRGRIKLNLKQPFAAKNKK